MNREEIKQYLPHREPMLIVDDAVVSPEGEVTGHYTVRGDEFFLQGHFPGNPVVPGVILCEIVAQAGAVLVLDKPEFAGATPYYAGLNNVRFKRMVRPGETLEIKCRMKKIFGNIGFGEGEAYVGDELAVKLEFSFALVK